MGIESPTHLLFLGVVALVVLGPRRLPDLARALGKGMREFREAMDAGASGHRVEQPAPQAANGAPRTGANGAALPAPAPADGESRSGADPVG